MADQGARLTFIDERNIDLFGPFLRRETGAAAGSGGLRLGCVTDGVAVGAIAAQLRRSGAYIESVAVAPSYRRRGLSAFMLIGLIGLLRDTGSARAYALASGAEDNAEAVRALLRGAGFELESADNVYTYRLSDIRERPLVQKMAGETEDGRIFSLSAAPEFYLRQLGARISAHGGADGLAEADDMDREAGVLFCNTDGVSACMLIASDKDGPEVRWLHGESQGALHAVVAAGIRRTLKRYGDDAQVRIAAVHPGADNIVTKLLGSAPYEKYSLEMYRILL
jgi:GNAT superfamily N-acetyltransferase